MVVQIIILLYLIDNNEQTSWMILMGSGVSVAIEAWKVRSLTVAHAHCSCVRFSRGNPLRPAVRVELQITKAVDISVGPAPPGALLPYKLIIKGMFAYTRSDPPRRLYLGSGADQLWGRFDRQARTERG